MISPDKIFGGAETQLRQTLLEYQAILDNASLGIVFTRNRTFLHCNERFGEMFGWHGHELIGQPTNIFYRSAEDYAELGRIAGPVLGSGQRLDIEWVMMRRDRSTFWCRMLAKAIDPGDHAKGTVFITEDITERKAAQDALLRARDDLELRVAERTAELAAANARLQQEIQERKQAEELACHLANHDTLTGLPNRRLLEDRLGGDEFVVVLPNMRSDAAAGEIGKKILTILSQPFLIENHVLNITPSIGISRYPHDGADPETLISRADDAMYQAKQNGRANVQFYAPRAGSASGV